MTTRLASLLLFLSAPLAAQRATAFGPQAKPFVVHDEPTIALRSVRLVDGTGAPPGEGQTIVIVDGRIAAIGPNIPIPAGATVIDLAGKTVLPGLVMLHEHLFYPMGRAHGLYHYAAQPFSFPKLYLAFGATTIRTGGSMAPYVDLNVKRDIDAKQAVGPTLFVTGPYIDRAGYPIAAMNKIVDSAGARRMVRYWAAEGVTSVKVYTFITRADLAAVVDEAHRHGIKVTGHLCSITYTEAAELGIDNLEHGLLANSEFVPGKQPDRCPGEGEVYRAAATLDVESPAVQRAIRTLVDRKIPVTSTLPIFETTVPGRPAAPTGALEAMSPEARSDYEQIQPRFAHNPDSTMVAAFRAALAWERAFVRAGGTLAAGTDPTGYGGTVAGYGNIRELELLGEAGFTPLEVITIASRNGARVLGIDRDVGTVERGKRADLLIVTGNPAEDLTVLERPFLVFKDGIGYDPAKLIAAVKGVVGIY